MNEPQVLPQGARDGKSSPATDATNGGEETDRTPPSSVSLRYHPWAKERKYGEMARFKPEMTEGRCCLPSGSTGNLNRRKVLFFRSYIFAEPSYLALKEISSVTLTPVLSKLQTPPKQKSFLYLPTESH